MNIRSGQSRAACPVCCRFMPVTKARLLRVHGPLSNRCKGSGMSPSLSPSTHPPHPLSLPSSTATPPSLSTAATPSIAEGIPDMRAGEASTSLLLPSDLRNSVRVLKRIPRASRHLAASKLASNLDGVTELNDSASWSRLLQFSHRCFAVPKRGGHRRSLAARVNRQLQEEAIPLIQPVGRSYFTHGSRAPLKSLARRVSTKLEEGDYRGAVRAASPLLISLRKPFLF